MLENIISVVRRSNWDEASRMFHEHWSRECPRLLQPNVTAPWDIIDNESAISSCLISPIATAYCLCEKGETDLSPLAASCGIQLNQCHSATVCGRVFRNCEPTYSCKQCASDDTCVMCRQCFQHSQHRFHKYSMASSSGSGYCDCGDLEAWKTYPSCELHDIQQNISSEEEKKKTESSLPQDVEERLRSMTRLLLRFSTSMVCWEDRKGLPNFLCEPDPSLPPYQTILFNDETHTYDSVIRALNLAINCSEQQAMLLATAVDREGRTSVRAGNAEFCTKAKDEIQRRTMRDTNRRTEKSGPLEVRVMDSRLVALQNFAIRLMAWLISQTQKFPPIAPIIGEVLLHDRLYPDTSAEKSDASSSQYESADSEASYITAMEVDNESTENNAPCDDTVLLHLMKWDRTLWKAARAHYHQLLMATVLMNGDQKQTFSRQFIRCYEKVLSDFVEDDHKHDVSITALTVQIFTVPTIARMLIAEEDAVAVIFNTLYARCIRYLKPPERLRFDFSEKSYPAVLNRALYTMTDQKYLLNTVPAENEWNDSLRTGFISGARAFIKFLSGMQEMDKVKRQILEHATYEREWETAFNMQLRSQNVITLLIAWACSDKQTHASLMSYLINQLVVFAERRPEFATKVPVTVCGITAFCIPYDVSKEEVSIHQPLWRLLAGLFTAPSSMLASVGIFTDTSRLNEGSVTEKAESRINLKGKRALLIEMPMRVLVLCAQAQAQMWRRNGFSLVNQIHNYLSPLCRIEMYDRDVLMMQVGAALTPPDDFLIRLLNRYSLHRWAELSYDEHSLKATSNRSPEELSKSIVTLAEEMLHNIISIIGERYLIGVGRCSREEILQREVLHILCTGPKPFSLVERLIPDCPLLEKLSLDAAVKTVADFRKPTATTPGMFSLKDCVRTQYNAFFYHYSKRDMSLADQYQRKERSHADISVSACPPPIPPPFEEFFQPITQLLRCKVLLNIVHVVIVRTIKRSRFSSDRLFHRVLFLIGMGLNEQRVQANFEFISEAEKVDIFGLLGKLKGTPEASSQSLLLDWVLQTYDRLKLIGAGVSVEKKKNDKVNLAENKAKRAAMAAKMRKQAMEQMNRMQRNFVTQNKALIESEKMDETTRYGRFDEDDEPMGNVPADSGFPVCLGEARISVGPVPSRKVTCIMCQEEEEIKHGGRPFVCIGFIQQSTLFDQRQTTKVTTPNEFLVPADLNTGMNISTCGHMMHFDCYQQYSDLIKSRERSRNREQFGVDFRIIDVLRDECMCPLCKRLGNTALPVLPPLSSLTLPRFSSNSEVKTFDEWVSILSELVNEPLHSRSNKSTKTHNRKRSHSEKSLVELTKGSGTDGTKPMTNNLSTSVPSASSLSLLTEPNDRRSREVGLSSGSFANSGMLVTDVLLAPTPGELVPSQPLRSVGSETTEDDTEDDDSEEVAEVSVDVNVFPQLPQPVVNPARISGQITGGTVQVNASDRIVDSRILDYIPSVMQKIKDRFIGYSKHSDDDLPSWWNTVKTFSASAAEKLRSSDDRRSLLDRSALRTVTLWQMTAFVLRSICLIQKRERKPLFGAFNTRQRECVYAISRLCAVAAFSCTSDSLRIMLGYLLTPLLGLPLPQQISAVDSRLSKDSHPNDAAVLVAQTFTAASGPYSQSSSSHENSSSGPETSRRRTLTFVRLPECSNMQVISGDPPSYAELIRSMQNPVNILSIDMLSLCVELSMCIGWTWLGGRMTVHNGNKSSEVRVIPDGSIDEQFAVRLSLIAHLFQVFATFHEESEPMDTTSSCSANYSSSASSSADPDLAPIISRLYSLVQPHRKIVSVISLQQQIMKAVVEFLRPISLLYHAITSVPPPESLMDPSLHEYESLCRYLGLPCHLTDLLNGACVERLFKQWRAQQVFLPVIEPVAQPIKGRSLIELPDDFADLINQAASFRCPSIQFGEHPSSVPTLCLVCGELLCSQGYCCQKTIKDKPVGACTYHLQCCSGQSGGIFLRIRESQVILLTLQGRGCFFPAPYVDEFGETDFGFRRGNPLHLNKDMYARLNRLWLQQEIQEEIVNECENDSHNITYEWLRF